MKARFFAVLALSFGIVTLGHAAPPPSTQGPVDCTLPTLKKAFHKLCKAVIDPKAALNGDFTAYECSNSLVHPSHPELCKAVVVQEQKELLKKKYAARKRKPVESDPQGAASPAQ